MKNVSFWGLARGMRLRIGNDQRELVDKFVGLSLDKGFTEVILPTIELQGVYQDKLSDLGNAQMWTFQDKKGRDVCLRPEGTATLQELFSDTLKYEHDVRLFYEARCFRYERPQLGRYREFIQFGVEIMNPRKDYREELINMSEMMVSWLGVPYELNTAVRRGLSYYTEDGWEISMPNLGAQKLGDAANSRIDGRPLFNDHNEYNPETGTLEQYGSIAEYRDAAYVRGEVLGLVEQLLNAARFTWRKVPLPSKPPLGQRMQTRRELLRRAAR